MTLDDRLRQGFEDHDRATLDQVASSGRSVGFEPSPRSLTTPLASISVGLIALAMVTAFLVRDSDRTIVEADLGPAAEVVVETTPATSAPATTEGAVPPPLITTTQPDPPETVTTTTSTGGTDPATTLEGQGQPTQTTASTNVPPDSTAESSTSTSAETEPTVPIPPDPIYDAIANTECASGFRAPLERATLGYVGPNQGWGRLDDLVDEQNGPFYFEAWEPGYPDEVTVEISLAEAVRATEIMVAQDPFTPVSGAIDIDAAGVAGSIPLSGTEGWRSFALPIGSTVSQFTIRRDAATENIMEVLVCVLDPSS